jgi:hypothetical protein
MDLRLRETHCHLAGNFTGGGIIDASIVQGVET